METLSIHMTIQELGWSGDALERLKQLRGARDLLDYMTEQAVSECRHNAQQDYADVVNGETRTATATKPISWGQIAGQLGVSRQTAWQRFRHLDDDPL